MVPPRASGRLVEQPDRSFRRGWRQVHVSLRRRDARVSGQLLHHPGRWVRFGYRRLLILLRRDGWDVGKQRLYRVYTEKA